MFLGKAIANYVLLLTLELVCLPIFGLFYNVDWTRQLWPLMLTIALATWGLSVVGTTFSAMTVNLRLRELMLPMLVYPIMIPCLLGAILLTADLVAGKPLSPDQLPLVQAARRIRHNLHSTGDRPGGYSISGVTLCARKSCMRLAAVAVALLVRNLYLIFLGLPDEVLQGAIYRIMFFHVPAGIIVYAVLLRRHGRECHLSHA